MPASAPPGCGGLAASRRTASAPPACVCTAGLRKMLLRGSAPRIECHNRQQRQVAHRGRQQRRSRLLVAAGSSVTQCQVARRGKQRRGKRRGVAVSGCSLRHSLA